MYLCLFPCYVVCKDFNSDDLPRLSYISAPPRRRHLSGHALRMLELYFFPRCFPDCNVYSPVGGSGDRCACLICKRYLQTSTLQDAVVTGKEARLMDSTAWRCSLNTLQTAFKPTPLAPACRTRGGNTQFLTVKRSLSRASRT